MSNRFSTNENYRAERTVFSNMTLGAFMDELRMSAGQAMEGDTPPDRVAALFDEAAARCAILRAVSEERQGQVRADHLA